MTATLGYFLFVDDPQNETAGLPWIDGRIDHLGSVEGLWRLRNDSSNVNFTVRCEKSENGYYFTDGWSSVILGHDISDQCLFILDVKGERSASLLMLSREEKFSDKQHFFKFNLYNEADCPVLPKKFVENRGIKDHANEYLNLIANESIFWKVKLEYIADNWMLTDGWGNVFEQYPLEQFYLLVFTYVSDTEINLRVFDYGGCEVSSMVEIGDVVCGKYRINSDYEEYLQQERILIQLMDGFVEWRKHVAKKDRESLDGGRGDGQDGVVNEEEENEGLQDVEVEEDDDGELLEDVTSDDSSEEGNHIWHITVIAKGRLRLLKDVERALNVKHSMTVRLQNLDGSVDLMRVRREKSGRTYRFAVLGWQGFRSKNGIKLNDKCLFEVDEEEGEPFVGYVDGNYELVVCSLNQTFVNV